MLKLNYNIRSLGTLYLIEIILYLSEKENYLKQWNNLEKNVYQIIAKKLGVSVDMIKTNIQKASMAADVLSENKMHMHLTPKNVISYVLDKMNSYAIK